MMNRRLGLVVLATALGLFVLLNGAWYYSYHDNSALGGTDKTPGDTSSSNPHVGGSTKEGVSQPELPPQVDPLEEQLLFDHEMQESNKDPQEPDSQKAATTTNANGAVETHHTTPGTGSADKTSIDWSRYAYVQYVTAAEHVCNSVLVFEALHRLGSRADRVLLYPQSWGEIGTGEWKKALDATSTKILTKAKDEYNVKLKPVTLIKQKGQERTWEAGFTKLLAFNETDYARTIMFDNDATVLRDLDHLFLLPPAPLAIPRAYWLNPDPLPEKTIHKYTLSAQLLVVTPNSVVFDALLDAVHTKGQNDYDMEIINWVLGPVALILPHRKYNLLSGEFRQTHTPGYTGYDRYLGITGETWNAKKVLNEAYYVHFSDWPRPKPWYHPHQEDMGKLLPQCYPKTSTLSGHDSRRDRMMRRGSDADMDCSDKETWLWLYSDFKDRRKNICGLDLLSPPW